ncbi:MAG TPA: hypothetical protein VNU01_06155 [Egibacteraceae bacterium]|nr:hypothetical protein [Egibacteraceae bacterium]
MEAAVLACDALCIFARGEYSVGQDHGQALQTLRSVEGGAALSKALGTALQAKKQHAYEVGLPKNSEMVALRRAAERLVQVAESRM